MKGAIVVECGDGVATRQESCGSEGKPEKTSITKEANLHSLRHSYATHLLEQWLNILTLKELPGHADITTTMIYLQVAQCPLIKPHSPLDRLYNCKGNADKV
ncbi:MAG: tyrosine-type recombinase/integrase [Bacteroidales bacterium]|nr:tyrosine-type recombinase/integrase [Bacteroidales bacterium]